MLSITASWRDSLRLPGHRQLGRPAAAGFPKPTGEMNLPDGNVIAPTGKAFDLDIATTARWDGDLLIEEFVFWDSALQAQQTGLA